MGNRFDKQPVVCTDAKQGLDNEQSGRIERQREHLASDRTQASWTQYPPP